MLKIKMSFFAFVIVHNQGHKKAYSALTHNSSYIQNYHIFRVHSEIQPEFISIIEKKSLHIKTH